MAVEALLVLILFLLLFISVICFFSVACTEHSWCSNFLVIVETETKAFRRLFVTVDGILACSSFWRYIIIEYFLLDTLFRLSHWAVSFINEKASKRVRSILVSFCAVGAYVQRSEKLSPTQQNLILSKIRSIQTANNGLSICSSFARLRHDITSFGLLTLDFPRCVTRSLWKPLIASSP